MNWCVEPIHNPSSLRSIYVLLEQREVNRRAKTIQQQQPYSAQTAQLKINRLKNRYCDIYPYDLNRLVLLNPIHGNDYINASWIQEPSFRLPAQFLDRIPKSDPPVPQTWIASQGPLRHTCYEFLSLCLAADPTKRPQVIIQLAECLEFGREKTADYIPSKVGESIEFKAHSSSPIFSPGSSTNASPAKYPWSKLHPSSSEYISHEHLRVTLESSESGPVHHPKDSNTLSTSNDFPSSFYIKNTLILELFNHHDDSCDQPSQNCNTNQLISKAKVIHYQCVGWSDRGVPQSVELILELITSAKINSILSEQLNPESSSSSTKTLDENNDKKKSHQFSPILVHCSAGVGRTGTLIAIASFTTLLDQFISLLPANLKAQALLALLPPLPFDQVGRLPSLPASLDHDLVAHTIDFLREQRVSMVQTEGQIGFVYKSVATLLHSLL